MLVVAEILDKLLHIVWLLMGEEMSLALKTTVVNQEVSVSHYTRYRGQDVIVHLVKLARLTSRYKQL